MNKYGTFKRTGIRLTAAAISFMLVFAVPATHVLATEDTAGETAQAASTEETKEEKKEDNPEEKDTSKDNADEGSVSDSGSEGTEMETPGAGDTSGKEEPGKGDVKIEDDGNGNGGDAGSGSTTAPGQKTNSGDKDNTGSLSGGEAEDGSSSAGASSKDEGSPSETDMPSETKEHSGTGSSASNSAAATDNTDASAKSTEQAAVPAAKKDQADSGTTAVLPDTASKDKDKNKDLKEKKTELGPDETPAGYDQAANHTGTNEQLIASQNIVSGLSILNDDFRFQTVEKHLAISSNAQNVLEKMKSSSRKVGTLLKNDMLYILSKERDGWLYIESGNVRGFVKEKDILTDKEADKFIAGLQAKLNGLGKLAGEAPLRAEGLLHVAKEIVPAKENTAYTYKRYTTKTTVIDKEYAIANKETSIREEADGSSRKVGRLSKGNLAYMITPVNEKWVYVESGNVRGFVKKSRLTTGSKAKDTVKEKGEANMATAEQYIEPEDNKALYYTLSSVKDGTAYSTVRAEIVKIASECIGNPYVWGGTSLTYGADCSGFVQTLYSMFGYKIPRVADAQSQYGTQIPVSDAAPGDLVFFAENGYVYHVALYAGDGMTIEAYSEDRGIIATDIGGRNAVWATRVIKD